MSIAAKFRGIVRPEPRSPERVALAEAVSAHQAALTALEGIGPAIMVALRQTSAAETAVDDAAEAVETARANAGAHLVAAALGSADAAPASVSTARATLADAQDALADARAARQDLDAYQVLADRAVLYAGLTLDECIRAVFRSEAAPLVYAMVKRHQTLRAELNLLAAEIGFIQLRAGVRSGDLPPDCWGWDNTFSRAPAPDRWEAWAAALRTDADAAMPVSDRVV